MRYRMKVTTKNGMGFPTARTLVLEADSLDDARKLAEQETVKLRALCRDVEAGPVEVEPEKP